MYLIKKEGKKERKKERNVLGRVYNVHSTHTTYSIQYSIYSTGHTVFSSLRLYVPQPVLQVPSVAESTRGVRGKDRHTRYAYCCVQSGWR